MQSQVEVRVTESAKECRIKSLLYSSSRQSKSLLLASLLEVSLNTLLVFLWYVWSSKSGFLKEVPMELDIAAFALVTVFFISRSLTSFLILFNYFSEIRISVYSDRIYLCKVFGGFPVREKYVLNLKDSRIDLSHATFLGAGIFHNFITERMTSACTIALISPNSIWSMNTNLINRAELKSILLELGCNNLVLVE